MSTVMKIRVELEFDPEANSWSAVCPELRGCVSAGTTREEAIANVKEAIALYGGLPVSDQGLTRERYLRLVEKVPADLRQRYLKVYAYY